MWCRFLKKERSLIHNYWPGVEEDEENEVGETDQDEDDLLVENMIKTSYCNGKNEVVKIFNQKCVICYEGDSVYAFRQCGDKCICEQCYQKNVV